MKISIIIPSYNTPEFMIRRVIDIIISQTFQDWELLIINDGPDKRLKDIVFSYKDKISVGTLDDDTKIRFHETEKRKGAAGFGRNIGIEHARGEYILFHDHDDNLFTNNGEQYALEYMWQNFSHQDTDIFIFNFKDQETNGSFIYPPFKPIDITKPLSQEDINTLKSDIILDIVPIWSKLYRRKFLLDNNFRFEGNFKRMSDVVFYFKTIFATSKIEISNTVCYLYRRDNENSLLTTIDKEVYKEAGIIKEIKDIMCKYGLYDYARLNLIRFFGGLLADYYKKSIKQADDIFEAKNYVREQFELLNITFDDLINERIWDKQRDNIMWLL